MTIKTNATETPAVAVSQSDESVTQTAVKSDSPASQKQTWALFAFTQVDVRNLQPALTISQASDLISQLQELRPMKKSDRTQFNAAIEGLREQLISAGGIDKRPEKKSRSERVLAGERRFDIGTISEETVEELATPTSRMTKAQLQARISELEAAEADSGNGVDEG